MNTPDITIRPAAGDDAEPIRRLVRSERLNPRGLDWPNFIVAVDAQRLIGAVQMRRHADGSRELGSLVVRPEARGRGLSARLIDTLLASQTQTVHMITAAAHAARYRHWGFRPVQPAEAPRAVRRNHLIGQWVGGLLSWLKRRPVRRLVILARPGRDTAAA